MNIKGYVKSFGNKSFAVLPFNAVDALILSQMSYVNFNYLIPDMGFVKLKDLHINKEQKKEIFFDSVDYHDNYSTFKYMMESTRYKNIKVGYFRCFDDKKHNKQFTAVTFILPNRSGFISFRGTDISMSGWREDFYIAFRDHVPGAKDAVEYVNNATTLFKGNFYLGGHSKGGNLAVYSSLNMKKRLDNRLLKVYSFDGPGFRNRIQDHPSYPRVDGKIEKYLTSNDMIGVIYNNIKEAKIVYSYGVLLGGHDPFRWLVDPINVDFVYTKDRSFMSKQYEEALMNWLTSMSDEDKALAVHIIFEMMGESENVYDLLLNSARLIVSGKKKWEEYTPQQRIQAREIFKKLGKYFLSAYSPLRFFRTKILEKKVDKEN